jgi:N-acetylmuramoyl-L-alanine amidase
LDRTKLIDPAFRDRVVEAMIAAVQRMYFPIEQDVKTGSIDVSGIRATLESAPA